MFKKCFYITNHAIEAFRSRVCAKLSNKQIRCLLNEILNTSMPFAITHTDGVVYKAQYNNKYFWVPVEKNTKMLDDPWDVVPTILDIGMKINEVAWKMNGSTINNATTMARELKIDRTTVVAYIKSGKIKASKSTSLGCYMIPESEFVKMKTFKKPYEKWNKTFSDTEIYLIVNNKGMSNKRLAAMLKRNENSVKIKRCRLRKAGYDV